MLKILLALLALILPVYAEAPPLRTLTTVRALSHEEAAKGLPVEIEGTVIFADPNDPGIIVHDGTTSCWFGAKTPFPDDLKSGSRVRATGRTESGSYFPNIAEGHAKIASPGAGHRDALTTTNIYHYRDCLGRVVTDPVSELGPAARHAQAQAGHDKAAMVTRSPGFHGGPPSGAVTHSSLPDPCQVLSNLLNDSRKVIANQTVFP